MTERYEYEMPAGPQRAAQDPKVGVAVLGRDHEVEDRSVVPDVVRACKLVASDVCHDPGDAPGRASRLGAGVL